MSKERLERSCHIFKGKIIFDKNQDLGSNYLKSDTGYLKSDMGRPRDNRKIVFQASSTFIIEINTLFLYNFLN